MQPKELTPRYAALAGAIEAKLGSRIERLPTSTGELGYRVQPDSLLDVCRALLRRLRLRIWLLRSARRQQRERVLGAGDLLQ